MADPVWAGCDKPRGSNYTVSGCGATKRAPDKLMSIVTKTGDSGTTGLMYNRRVPKNDPRVEAYGDVDELNAAIGVSRAACRVATVRDSLLAVQKDLVAMMGELATLPEDQARYDADGYPRTRPEFTARLEAEVVQLESVLPPLRGWHFPGNCAGSAALHLARTVCRRAERRVFALGQMSPGQNPEVLIYLNRLADLMWLLARQEEAAGMKD